jgi:hypothetical protein
MEAGMKRMLAYKIAAAVLVAAPSIASATTLLDLTNIPGQSDTITSLQFTAGAGSTTLSIGGYNPPAFLNVFDIELTVTGDSTNLLGQTFDFASAGPACTGAFVSGPGAFGTDDLNFGSFCVGVNDTFSQTIATSVGDSYTLSFLLSSSGSTNGLLITASNANVADVPEPATWATMMLGFCAVGFAMRRRRQIGLTFRRAA